MANTLVRDMATTEQTVRAAATGDEAAFATLVAEHHASMTRVAFVVCGDAEATLDAVQSAWTIAWSRIDSLRDPGQVRPWLLKIVANEARQANRRRRRLRVVDISDQVGRASGDDPTVAAELVDLERALRRLKPDERALLGMRYAADLESAEIARQLGLSASGVRSRLARLLERLRADLALGPEAER